MMPTSQASLTACALLLGAPMTASADPSAAAQDFADHCFSPYLTADTAQNRLGGPDRRVDFYDLRPFSSAPPSPATGTDQTPGTDRRCEVSFDGAHVDLGIAGVQTGLLQEDIATQAKVPDGFPAQAGTQFIAARQLNPRRIAVVQVGTRSGPQGVETFINVERLAPLAEPLQ